jgi:hypothetical protein
MSAPPEEKTVESYTVEIVVNDLRGMINKDLCIREAYMVDITCLSLAYERREHIGRHQPKQERLVVGAPVCIPVVRQHPESAKHSAAVGQSSLRDALSQTP